MEELTHIIVTSKPPKRTQELLMNEEPVVRAGVQSRLGELLQLVAIKNIKQRKELIASSIKDGQDWRPHASSICLINAH